MTSSPSLPPADSPAFLRDAAGTEHFSRIIETRPDSVVVAAPRTFADAHEHIGAAFQLLWVTNVWARSLPVRLLEVYDDAAAPVWVLAAAGWSATERRRSSVRVPITGAVAVTLLDPGSVAADDLAGRLVDVTDGALHARLAAAGPVPGLSVGARVACVFAVGDSRLRITGRITSHRRDAAAGEEHAVVVWDEDEHVTAVVRDYIHRSITAAGS